MEYLSTCPWPGAVYAPDLRARCATHRARGPRRRRPAHSDAGPLLPVPESGGGSSAARSRCRRGPGAAHSRLAPSGASSWQRGAVQAAERNSPSSAPTAGRQKAARCVTPTRPRGLAMRKLMGLSFNCCGCVRAGGPACRLPRSWALDAMLWPAAEMCPAFRYAAAAARPCLLGWPHLLRA
jgi:hypothetical protein